MVSHMFKLDPVEVLRETNVKYHAIRMAAYEIVTEQMKQANKMK